MTRSPLALGPALALGLGLAALAAGRAGAEAPLPVAFDLIVSSGSATPNGITVPAPVLLPGDNPGNIFRFDGRTGVFEGFFAREFQRGLQDPRDLVLSGPAFGRRTTLLVNAADFNSPTAVPGDGEIDLDAVFRYDLRGRFLGRLVDFRRALDVPVSPGGGVFGPSLDPGDDPAKQSYFVGSRALGDVIEIDPDSGRVLGSVPGTETIDFPRGFVFTGDGTLFIGSGSNPATGAGDDAILKIDPVTADVEVFFSAASAGESFSPLDVVLSPGGTSIIATSESPFSPGEVTPSRIFILPLDFRGPEDLIVLDPGDDADGAPLLVDPRGIGIGPDGLLYVSSAGNDTILRFDPFTGAFVDVFAWAPGLNGQALSFLPDQPPKRLLGPRFDRDQRPALRPRPFFEERDDDDG